MRQLGFAVLAVLALARAGHADCTSDLGGYVTPSTWVAGEATPNVGGGIRLALGGELVRCGGDVRSVVRVGITLDLATWARMPVSAIGTAGIGLELDADIVPFSWGALGLRAGVLHGDPFNPSHTVGSDVTYQAGVRVRLAPLKLGLDAIYSPRVDVFGLATTSARGVVVTIEPTGSHPTLAIATAIAIFVGVAVVASYELGRE